MNVRYFQTDKGHWWFGGGIDVTPHYINKREAGEFHALMHDTCERFFTGAYNEYKKWADDYFYNAHRGETRGIGGIFFDKLNESRNVSKEQCWSFVTEVGEAFIPAYQRLFIPNYRKEFTEDNKAWQRVRRGRYVEFNLVYDRGTKFGLQTNGRIESILMSMPPQADWLYNYQPVEGSDEARTQSLLQKDVDWLSYKSA